MGAASTVISGISQVVGVGSTIAGLTRGGGTAFQPDPRAKHEADLLAFTSAIEAQKMQEDILKGQLAAQNDFNQYSFDMQNMQLQKEMELGFNDIQTQYQQALFQNGLERQQLEQENYLRTQQYNASTLANEANRFATQQELELNRQLRQVNYASDETQRSLRAESLKLGQDLAKFNEKMINARNSLDVEKLKAEKQDLLYGQQQFDIALDTANQNYQQSLEQLSLSDRQNFRDASFQKGVALNQRDKTGLQLQQRENQLNQELTQIDDADSQAKVNEQLSKAQSEFNRGESLRDLLRQISRSERQYSQFEALLGAQDRGSGSQAAGVGFDQLVNDDTATQRRSMMERYGLEQGTASLESQSASRRANTSRRFNDISRSFVDVEGQLADRDLSNSFTGIDNQLNRGLESNRLARRQGGQDLQEQIANIMNQKNRANDVGQSGIAIGGQEAELSKLSGLASNAQQQGNAELELAQLKAQSLNDLFSRSLLPDVRDAGQGMLSAFNSTLDQHLRNTQEGVRQQQTQSQRDNLQRQGLIDVENAKSAFSSLPLQWYNQAYSNLASNTANQGNTRMQEYSGLNQIGAQTHGLLSQLGGYRSPPPA